MRQLRCAATVLAVAIGLVAAQPAAGQVTVMTQNLYIGFDIEQYAVDLTAEPFNVAALTTAAYEQVLSTDFASRAAAFARQVEATQPAIVGLQEVALYRSDPFDGFGAPHATTVEIDFLELTLDALADRGLHYAAVATVENADAEFPRITGYDELNNPLVEDIRLTDRDAILVRTDLPPGGFAAWNPQAANFANAASLLGVDLPRGWVSVDVQAGPLAFRVVSTHLDNDPSLQLAQAGELLGPGSPSDTDLPVVLIGDFNSRADGTGTATYAELLASGFADAWTMTHGDEAGYTWGHDAGLLNTESTFTERIDLVLLGGTLQATFAEIVGEELADRTPSGLWLSDHAGVVATIVPEPGSLTLAAVGAGVFWLRRRQTRLADSGMGWTRRTK
ncbi:MAG: endonuclease [Planctomycetota bacterium]|nr:MAG: endonuclease [Planctomycetota bacterium]